MGWQRGCCSWPHARAATEIAPHPKRIPRCAGDTCATASANRRMTESADSTDSDGSKVRLRPLLGEGRRLTGVVDELMESAEKTELDGNGRFIEGTESRRSDGERLVCGTVTRPSRNTRVR